jgi:hypothetical protein
MDLGLQTVRCDKMVFNSPKPETIPVDKESEISSSFSIVERCKQTCGYKVVPKVNCFSMLQLRACSGCSLGLSRNKMLTVCERL